MKLQGWFVDHVCLPVFEGLAGNHIAERHTWIAGSEVLKFNAPEFRPRRWSWVDPQKDINAQVTALRTG